MRAEVAHSAHNELGSEAMSFSIRTLFLSVAIGVTAAFSLPQAAHAQGAGMEITVGSWGYGSDRKDVKADIGKRCNGKSTCAFMVKNENLGLTDATDPSPGNDKGLMVFWKCGETVNKDQFPQNKEAVLKCK
jgi:hypothetical protein